MDKAKAENEVAAIDNDFLQHLLEIKYSKDLAGLINRFFNALGVSVTMHPLVYKYEAKLAPGKQIRDKLFREKVISVTDLGIFLGEKKDYYFLMVKTLYKSFMGKEYPCSVNEKNWVSGKSLGEVHTVVMCILLSYQCFLSDDKGSKKILQNIVNDRLLHPITIYNRQDGCDIIKAKRKEDREELTSKELSLISHSKQ